MAGAFGESCGRVVVVRGLRWVRAGRMDDGRNGLCRAMKGVSESVSRLMKDDQARRLGACLYLAA